MMLTLTLLLCATALAQESAQPVTAARALITQPVDESKLTTLKGNTHLLARPEFDLGTAPATLPMERMLLVLKRSPEQEAALGELLDNQHDKASPNYHQWLTPEEFGNQFGPTDEDLQTITGWLQSHGFRVGTTKGRTVLEFSGSASQVQEAFHTAIHKYIVNGEQHWANASDPQIPTALTPAVAGVLTLHNFIKKPAIHFTGTKIPAKLIPGKKPEVTFPPQNGQPALNALGPQDYAVIYNIKPVYTSSITGNGINIAVIGRTDLNTQDVYDFTNVLGFASGAYGSGNFVTTQNGPDPGDLGGSEEAEATLDSSWARALAPDANVTLVVSATTNTTDGIDLSEAAIVEGNGADVMTESFSACELYATDAQLAGQRAMAAQAAGQGITYLVSTGDDGAEGCDDPGKAPATHPISVNYLASTAFNVAVGGTMFNENGDPNKYWTSAAPLAETAISYIPENVWNESSSTNGLWSSSGGASAGNFDGGFGGTTAGVAQPNWQYGVEGIPPNGVRDLPDVSLTAAGHDPYLLCLDGSCEPNAQGEIFFYTVGGTSASTPSFAAIMALVDQSIVGTTSYGYFPRQGLANYVLYGLAAAQQSYPSQCDGSNTASPPVNTCVFNDVTTGNNVVPGETGTQYQAAAGYDMATGLGSVNVSNLVNNWSTVSFNPTTTTLTVTIPNTITHGTPVPFSVDVTPNSGSGIPSGNVSLLIYESDIGGLVTGSLGPWALSAGSVSASTSALPGGVYPISARYGGDRTYAPSTSPQFSYIFVYPEPSSTTVSVLTADQNGTAVPFTGGPFGSFVYLRADVAAQSGQGIPGGTITFTDSFGPIPGVPYPLPLNTQGNTATPNGVLNFDTGTHTISASYSGDGSFNPSSSTQSQTFTITPGFYASISNAPTVVVISAPGASGQTQVTIANSTGFSGTISLACSGLPYEATCTFTPSTLAANGTPNTAYASITVSTTAPATTRAAVPRSQQYLPTGWVLGTGLLFSALVVSSKHPRARGVLLLLIVALAVTVPSCGGGSSSGPPPNTGTPTGNSNVIVTATSGTTKSQTGFTLVVQ
ncbi:MAG: protease pro-enzyme activation domain-containing protein [Candidatus Sulfotelmatobacter sp.]